MSNTPQEQICLICQKPIENNPGYWGEVGPFHHNCWLKMFVATFSPIQGLSREEVRQRAAINAPIDPISPAFLKQENMEKICQKRAMWAVSYANALVAELEKPCQE